MLCPPVFVLDPHCSMDC